MRNLWNTNKCGFFLAFPPLLAVCTAPLGLFTPLLLLPAFLCVLAYPVILTAVNLYFLSTKRQSTIKKNTAFVSAVITLPTGLILTLVYSTFKNITGKDWFQQLYNSQLHTPIANQYRPAFILFASLGVLGFLLLSRFRSAASRPPLVTVLCISMMYLGCLDSLLYMIQVSKKEPLFFLLPFNCLIITAQTIRQALTEWRTAQQEGTITIRTSYHRMNCLLLHSERWPLLAFLLLFPLLGVLICILILCGQAPDSIIKAFTETSDWALSRRISPNNVQYDEHYLCTVAAGGHPKLVKPLRLGQRHDHVVTVNRQLCIANAFEQLLEERAPSFHKTVRHIYDTYGYPIARHIHSPYTADLIYLLMKPAEYLFLTTLYLFDPHPETRIARQYLPPGR